MCGDEDMPESDSKSRPAATGCVATLRQLRASGLLVATHCALFCSFGMAMALVGATMPLLLCMAHVQEFAITWIVAAPVVSNLVGSVVAGLLSKRVPINPMLLFVSSGLPVTMGLMSICNSTWSVTFALICMGLCAGCIDALSNITFLLHFVSGVGPFLQVLHFCYGLGTLISPTISGIFQMTATACTHTDNDRWQHFLQKRAFIVIAVLQIPACILVLVSSIRGYWGSYAKTSTVNHCEDAYREKSIDYLDDDQTTTYTTENSTLLQRKEKEALYCKNPKSVLAFAGVLVFMFDGIQGNFGGYVFVFSTHFTSKADLNAARAITPCFWAFFTIGRLISVCLNSRLSPSIILIINVVGIFSAAALLTASYSNIYAIIVATSLMGLFLSSSVPTVLAMADTLVQMTNCRTTYLVIFAAIGESVIPIILGSAMTRIHFAMFTVVNLGITTVCLVFVALLLTFGLDARTRKFCRYVCRESELLA